MADPIFDIDGRIVGVIAAVSPECIDPRVHFALTVAAGADASWSAPEGEQLSADQVTIAEGKSRDHDNARLIVSVQTATRDPGCRVRVQVSGAGLRGGDIDREGSARGVKITLHLTRSADAGDDD